VKSPTPVEVRRCPDVAELRVTWDDGAIASLPYRVLRANCRCATCRAGLSASDGATVGVHEVALFGEYAVRLFFDDGHNTGLFPFDYLRRLAAAQADV